MGIVLNLDILGSAGSVMTMLKDVGKELDAMSKKGASSFDKLAAVGKVATGAVIGGAVAVGVKTTKMAADFQTGMTSLQTGAGESAANMKMVGDGILNMAGQVGESTSSLVDGMYHIESAGFHGAAGLNVLKTAAEGAKVGNADLDTMGKTLVGTMNSYGMAGDKASSMMNQLIATTASGDMRMQDLASSLGNVTPVAAAAGVNFAQVGGAVATMTSQNMSAQQATQDLAFLIRNLANVSPAAAKEMSALGLNAQQVQQDLGKKGLTGTLDELTSAITRRMGPSGLVLQSAFNTSKSAMADAKVMLESLPPQMTKMATAYLNGSITQKEWTASLKGLSPEAANQGKQFATLVKEATGFSDIIKQGGPAAQTYTAALSEMTGGATGLNASLMLTGPNASVFASNVKTIGDAAKATGGQVTGWDTVQKTFNQRLAEAKGHVEALGIKLGTALIPVVERVATVVMSVVTWFGKHRDIALAVAAVVGGALTVAMGAYFVKVAKGLIDSAVGFGKFVLSSGKAMLTAGKAVAEFAVEMASMAAEAATAFLSMAAEALTWAGQMALAGAEALLPFWPIIAVVAAVGAAAYLLYKYWDQVWGFIKEVVSAAFGWIRDHIKLIIAVLLGPLGLAIDAVWTHWKWIWNLIKVVSKAVWDFLRDDVIHPLVDVGLAGIRIAIGFLSTEWSIAWGVIRDVAVAVWHFLDTTVVHPAEVGLGYIRGAIRTLSDAWATAWHAISDVALGVWRFVNSNIIQPVVNVGIHAVRDAINELKDLWKTAWDGIQSVVQAVWSVIKPIFDAIIDAGSHVSDAIDAVGHAAGNVGHAAGNVGHAIGNVGRWFGFADGGPVPGPKGAPMLAVVHGGEYVLSNDMLDGRASIGAGAGSAMAGTPVIQIYTAGSVVAQEDFFEQLRTWYLQNGGRFSSTYTKYAH